MGERSIKSTNSHARHTLPQPFPPPDKPLPARPPAAPAVPPRASRSRRDDAAATASSISSCSSTSTLTFIPASQSTPSSSSSMLHRHSVTPEPLSIPRRPLPRPDSTILPVSPPLPPLPSLPPQHHEQQYQQRPSGLLVPCDFHAVVRQGDMVQYWLPVSLVLRGMPGREALPRGHWERMVQLAEDVAVGATGEQLVTGWCTHDESLGDVEDDESESDYVYEDEDEDDDEEGLVSIGW